VPYGVLPWVLLMSVMWVCCETYGRRKANSTASSLWRFF
jgi:hypothetical protein